MLKLALTPKWIVALILCLAMAFTFAGLAQWQIARTILPTSSDYYTDVAYLNLEDVSEPGQPYSFEEVTKKGKEVILNEVLVRAQIITSDAVLVNKRVQLDESVGSWIVIPAKSEVGKLFIAFGFIENPVTATEVLDQIHQVPNSELSIPIAGRYLPSEAPLEQTSGGSFDSLSVPQLVNYVDWGTEAKPVYPGFIAVTKANQFTSLKSVDVIEIGLAKMDSGINWLSLFYALEWVAFALFAVFMWWRLLADAYKKQQEALLEDIS